MSRLLVIVVAGGCWLAAVSAASQSPALGPLARFAVGAAAASGAVGGNMSYLDDGRVRVGVDLGKGGVITYLAPSSGGESVINDHDLGREVQQSYYSGPSGLGTPCPGFGSGWNPIGGGDCHGHASTVITSSNDGTMIYVKSIPLQWAFDNVSCECTFEHWITLDGNSVRVHNRLTNNRADRTQYPAQDQELPAVYTVGRLYRLFSYEGGAPFTDGPLTEEHATLPQATYFWGTESWAALVDNSGWGLGVFKPDGSSRFLGGFAGVRGAGGPADDATGYVSPTDRPLLDWNVVYEYDYTLVLGSLAEIRGYALAHRPNQLVDFQFTNSREGWSYVNASDAGLPISNVLHARLDRDDPQLWSPARAWPAKATPTLYIRATYPAGSFDAQLFWATAGGFADFSEEQSVHFTVVGDGHPHTYAVKLAGQPGWNGTIGRLRLDPAAVGGISVDIDSISSKPTSTTVGNRDRRALTLAITGQRATGRLSDAANIADCIAGQQIRIKRKKGTAWIIVATTRTSVSGTYNAKLAKRRGTYRAAAPATRVGGDTCLATTSAAVRSP